MFLVKTENSKRKLLLQSVRSFLIWLFGRWEKIEDSSLPRTFYIAEYIEKNKLFVKWLNVDVLDYYYTNHNYVQILEFRSKNPNQQNNYRIFGFEIKNPDKNGCYLEFNKKFLNQIKQLINSKDYQFVTYFNFIP